MGSSQKSDSLSDSYVSRTQGFMAAVTREAAEDSRKETNEQEAVSL